MSTGKGVLLLEEWLNKRNPKTINMIATGMIAHNHFLFDIHSSLFVKTACHIYNTTHLQLQLHGVVQVE